MDEKVEVAPQRGRLDTSLEAEGAEFLVLGHLLLNRIVANKAYSNTKDYDLIAVNPSTQRSITIQVKSRFRSDARHFLIKEASADFVVLAQLNRGPNAKGKGGPIAPPNFVVLSRTEANGLIKTSGKIGKIAITDIARERWNQWGVIGDALGLSAADTASPEDIED